MDKILQKQRTFNPNKNRIIQKLNHPTGGFLLFIFFDFNMHIKSVDMSHINYDTIQLVIHNFKEE